MAQIAERLGATEETVLAAMEVGGHYRAASRDSAGRGPDGGEAEVPSIDGAFDLRVNVQALIEALPALDGAQRLIIQRTFFEGRTQRQVAGELGVSQMQISRLRARGGVGAVPASKGQGRGNGLQPGRGKRGSIPPASKNYSARRSGAPAGSALAWHGQAQTTTGRSRHSVWWSTRHMVDTYWRFTGGEASPMAGPAA